MALIRCDFFSEALSLSTSMTVLLPQRTTGQVGLAGVSGDEPPPVLYLLHGMSDDATTWVRRTSVERYVAPLGLAVVMPQVHRSYYTDEVYGGRYWTFLSEELPALVRQSVEGVQALLDNLLHWAAGQRGELSYHPETILVAELLQHVHHQGRHLVVILAHQHRGAGRQLQR